MQIDRGALSTPIPGDAPSGEWLRREGTYAAVREAMRHDPGDPAYGIPEKRPDWLEAATLCHDALCNRTKDFYLACCMTEALAHIDGCEGLAAGLWTLAELHERFWDDFHPRPRDEGRDIDARVNQLEALIQNWQRVLDGLPMGESEPTLRMLDWRLIENSSFTVDDKEETARSSSWDFYDRCVRGLQDAAEQLKRFDDQLDARYGNQAPSLGDVRALLDDATQVFKGLLSEKGPSPHEERAREILGQTNCDFLDLDWLTGKVRDVSYATILNSVTAAVADRAGGLQPEQGWQALLDGHWSEGRAYAQQTEGAPPPPAAPEPVAARVAAAPAAPVAAAPAVAQVSGRGGRETVLAQCKAWRAAEPGNPAPYVLVRELRWMELRGAGPGQPPPGPPGALRQQCQSLFDGQNWPQLLELCESSLEGQALGGWLDLQRFACAAMGQIGSPYGDVREAVIEALARAMLKRRWLLEADLSDGHPAADEITRNWMGIEVDAAVPKAAAAAPATNGAGGGDDSLQKAMERLETEGLEAAISLLQDRLASADGVRERAVKHRDMGEVCLAADRPDLAVPILEGLRSDLHGRDLSLWEGTNFMGRTLEALYRSYRLLAASQPSDEWDARMRSVADELAHVDLARRIRLESAE